MQARALYSIQGSQGVSVAYDAPPPPDCREGVLAKWNDHIQYTSADCALKDPPIGMANKCCEACPAAQHKLS